MANIKEKKSELVKQEHPIYIVSQPMDSNDEIDLRDLLNAIFKKKFFLITWCFIITLIALIIALTYPKNYIAKTTFYPPTPNDISTLNIKDTYTITTSEAYSYLIKNLKLKNIRESLFESLQEKSDEFKTTKFISFNKKISLKESKNNKKSLKPITETILSFSSKNPEQATLIINTLLDNAIADTKVEIIALRNKIITTKEQQLQDKIEVLRNSAKQLRLDTIARLEANNTLKINTINAKIKNLLTMESEKKANLIVRLQESSTIANSIGLKNPLDYQRAQTPEDNLKNISYKNNNFWIQNQELYKDGSLALNARIKAIKGRKDSYAFIPQILTLKSQLNILKKDATIAQLKERQNDDPFISGLRTLEERIAILNKAAINPSYFSPLSLKVTATTPNKPTGPRKLYILIAGMFIALISGIGIVLIQHFLKQQ